MIHSYISIDLETTGLNPRRDRITEIGAIKVIDGAVTETFSTLVNPGRKLDPEIAALTGIRDEELECAPVIGQVLPGLLDFLEDLPFLGHSILFDFSFLKKAAVDQRIEFRKQAVDTLRIARKYLSHLEHRSLDFLCLHYGIPHQAHRALEDAVATEALYRRLAEEFGKEGDPLFDGVEQVFRVKRDTPATKSQKERLYLLAARHKIELGADIEQLSRSEASRMTDKILARFGKGNVM